MTGVQLKLLCGTTDAPVSSIEKGLEQHGYRFSCHAAAHLSKEKRSVDFRSRWRKFMAERLDPQRKLSHDFTAG